MTWRARDRLLRQLVILQAKSGNISWKDAISHFWRTLQAVRSHSKFFNNISPFSLTSKWIFKVLNIINVNKTNIFSIFAMFSSFLLFLPYLFVHFIICTFVLTLLPSWLRQLKFFVQLLNWTRLCNVLKKFDLLSSSRVNFK